MGQLIAITVEKGMDWKNVVIPTVTKPTASTNAPATPAAETAPAAPAAATSDKPPPSGQYVKKILC